MSIETIEIDNGVYYDSDELKRLYPKFFLGTGRSTRGVLDAKRNKKITKNDYVFATFSKKYGWKKC